MEKFIINETSEEQILRYMISESFIPKADIVLKVKNYIDKNFAKQTIDDIENGYPKKVCTVVMLSADKQPLKTLQLSEFLLLLDDKFHTIIKNDEDRKKFLKQVIKDWFTNSIDNNGLLSVNHI